ncbi:cytochrome P450 [Cyathus striatus]|nr:cytochrome P450 [Cyathus striatus]
MESEKAQLDILHFTFGSFLLFTSFIAFQQAFPDLHSFSMTNPALLSTTTVIFVSLFTSACIAFQRSIIRDTSLKPPTVHSYLPWIGCAIAYFRSPRKFLKESSAKYGPVFRFQVAGRWITALSSPAAISSFLRDRSGAFDVIQMQMIPVIAGLRSGNSRSAYVYSVVNEKALPILHRGLSQRSIPKLAPDINAGIVEHLGHVMQGRDHIEEMSSQSFVLQILYSAVSQALLGPKFPAANFREFTLFNDGIPYIMQRRSYLVPGALRAREILVNDWAHFISENWKEDEGGYLDGASNFITDILRSLKISLLTSDEIARLMNGVFFGMHTNIIGASTWVLYHLLLDKITMDLIQEELRDIVDGHATSNINVLLKLEPSCLDHKFPILTSLVKEVLRTKMLPSSVRNAMRDVTLYTGEGAIFIPKGDIVMADVQSLHHNPELHESPEVFKADRFADENGKQNSKTLSFFGTGKHICAGRYHAMNSIRMFIILCLHLYDIQLAPSSPAIFPDIDDILIFSTLARARMDLMISVQTRKF